MGYRGLKGDAMKVEKIAKVGRIGWVNWMLLTLCFIGIPALAQADVSDILLKFYPYLTVQEEYSTNILLSPNRFKLADYITTINPGLRFNTLKPGEYWVDLDVSGGYTYYKKNHDFSYWDYHGRLDTWYAVDPKLTFRLRDYSIRSDAARELQYGNLYDAEGQYIGDTQPDQYLIATQSGVHGVYIRNVAEPSVEYRFGRENLVRLLYRNNIYDNNNNPLFEDSTENSINPLINYWFDVRNGITVEYALTFGHFQTSPNLVSHMLRDRYTYRVNPKLSFFGEYIFIREDLKNPGLDYDVHNPSLGIQYRFSPTLTGTLQGGYFWQLSQDDLTTRGPFFHVDLTQRAQKTSYALVGEGGYYRDYFTSQNLGFNKYYRAYGTINHWFTPRWSAGLTGSVDRVWYPESRKDWIWDARLRVSYALFRWLTVGLEGGHREDRSTSDGVGYSEYSGIVWITLARPGYQPGAIGGPVYR
jgi:hypothetical protein